MNEAEALAEALKSVPAKRRPSTDRALLVALRLGDHYRPNRGHVDDSIQQIRKSVGFDPRDALNALDACGIWIIISHGGGPSKAATRRSIGPVLAQFHAKTPPVDNSELSGADPAQLEDVTQRGDGLTQRGRAPNSAGLTPLPHQTTINPPDDDAKSVSTENGRDGRKEEKETPTPTTADVFNQAATTASETRSGIGFGKLSEKQRLVNAERARVEWSADATRWANANVPTSEIVAALAERINGNTTAAPRSITRDSNDHGTACGCRDCRPDLHPAACDCIDCAAAGLQHVAPVDESTPVPPPAHLRALLAQGIGHHTNESTHP